MHTTCTKKHPHSFKLCTYYSRTPVHSNTRIRNQLFYLHYKKYRCKFKKLQPKLGDSELWYKTNCDFYSHILAEFQKSFYNFQRKDYNRPGKDYNMVPGPFECKRYNLFCTNYISACEHYRLVPETIRCKNHNSICGMYRSLSKNNTVVDFTV